MSVAEDQVAVYRLRDAAGDLLYVGVSTDPQTRLDAHRSGKPWGGDVASIEIVWCESRHEALAAEGRAIRDERPRHNRLVPREAQPCRFNAGIAANIARAREAVGMTPRTLARALGVRAVSVTRWEAGRTRPDETNEAALVGLLFAGSYTELHRETS